MINQKGGSFGVPNDVMEAIRESKNKEKKTTKKPPTMEDYVDSESIPELETLDKEIESVASQKEQGSEKEQEAQATKELTPEEQFKKDVAEARKSIGVQITDDDIWEMLLNKKLVKKGIVIVPGKLEATFKTLSAKEMREIDSKLKDALEDKYLETGFRNLQTNYLLAYGVVELGRPGKLRSLGANEEARFKEVSEMSGIVIEKIAKKWNTFQWLMSAVLEEELSEGKS